MKVVVISPEHEAPHEHAVLAELFAAGLTRYHVRKPHASSGELETWLKRVPLQWRSRLVLHQHHELVSRYGLGGCHWKDKIGRIIPNPPFIADEDPGAGQVSGAALYRSRSCHNLDTVRKSVGLFDAVFFGPVFDSISKPGYGPEFIRSHERERVDGGPLTHARGYESIAAFLHNRTAVERRTAIYALGGIDATTAPRAMALGFDGVALLGAIWLADDPVAMWHRVVAASRESGSQAPQCSGESVRKSDVLQDFRKAV